MIRANKQESIRRTAKNAAVVGNQATERNRNNGRQSDSQEENEPCPLEHCVNRKYMHSITGHNRRQREARQAGI